MSNATTWRLLIVDDEKSLCDRVQEYLAGEFLTGSEDRLEVQGITDFNEALDTLQAHRFDILILDVRLQTEDEVPEEEAGVTALNAIRQRRFVPVIFYTGLPHLVRHLQSPFVQVVEKEPKFEKLLQAVQEIHASRLPLVNRALLQHLETVQRDYMWDFVQANWDQFKDAPDRTALAYLLARRLAISLSGPGIHKLAQNLGNSTGDDVVEGKVHPMQYYLMPSIEPTPLSGDVYKGQIGDQTGHWVLLTPSCDLVKGREKADWVLFGRCILLSEQSEYQKWCADLPQISKTAKTELEALLNNSRQIKGSQPERFFFLPGALSLPDMLLDFQQLVALPVAQMDKLKRLASLDSPFAEALLARFARYFGRLGTPDLDLDVTVARLQGGLSLKTC
jgi:CheY-like chemotaxis protein